MISGIDHVVIAVRDIEAAVAAYQALLATVASATETKDDVARAIICSGNFTIELMSPTGPRAIRLAAALEDGGEGLKSLVFSTASIEKLHTRCQRVGLVPEAIIEGARGRSFRVPTDRTGVRLFFMQREVLDPPAGGPGLDHLVIRSPDLERAAALYGARLGLDMRLDREVMGRRLMFFRCGDAIVEIIHDNTLVRDTLWGLSWRVADAAKERERLATAGLNVSEVRDGAKPGSRVFTVRDQTCGVPTLMIETRPKHD